MTDLDRLRAAMQESPPVVFAPVDLERVMAEGTRLRRRRQARIVVGSVTAVAAVTAIAVAGASWLRPPDPGMVGAPPSISTPTPTPTTVPTTPPDPSGPPMLGDMIRTGEADASGELVFYVHELAQGRFGITAGRRAADGTVSYRYTTNETDGTDRGPGFHGASVATGTTPAFGYYVGPAVKITAKIAGKTAVAHQAEWSVDRSLKIWWFDLSTDEPTGLAAFDAGGKPLPAGNTGFGRG
ncbi:hypothetical protein [Alloactinosynnema sp. L-07]|uniref:hypothetical protein n=1 Tax=Alloactinosynnema sp. L-07 TaxID=1653480 RepID=UPI00065EF8F6|nr:hypothetical protein [Alloactinosynnema sp. L-07]CRK57207.1 hypothetical protein [Alloactinosynnema sp. L-07]